MSEYDIERWMLNRTVKEQAMDNGPISIEDIMLIDREIFGANRSGLLRSLAQEARHLTLVDKQEGKITGYSFGRLGSRVDHVDESNFFEVPFLVGFLINTERIPEKDFLPLPILTHSIHILRFFS